MSDQPALPPFAAVVVAAGQGLRAGQPVPKQFASWRGKPVLRHSIETLLLAGAKPLVVVIPQGGDHAAQTALEGLDGWFSVVGGATRQESVLKGLEALSAAEHVLIHDAARPDIPVAVIQRLVSALADHPGAIPSLSVVDSLAHADGDLMAGSAQRESLRRVQTPQAFRFGDIMAAHRT